jgi:AcrR family transcriptional regulator
VNSPKTLGDIRAPRTAMEAETRAILLGAGATILSEEGPLALTVRRVAASVGASTKMIYTHFGGKDGLFEALYLHSFAAFTRALESEAGVPDPLLRVRKMAAAYRAFALGEPSLYAVMFGDLGRAWEAPIDSRRQAWRSFETLRDAIRASLPQEKAKDASRVTYLLWATMHGVVSLELRKLIGETQDPTQIFDLAVEAILTSNEIPSAPLHEPPGQP